MIPQASEPVLGTGSEAERLAVRRCSVSMDVSALAPAGCQRIAADLFVPQSVRPRPLLWVCVPGGGISRRYFDLDVAGQNGAFSMARHLAAGGDLVVTVDPPGVGESDAPDDGYTLTPRVVADVLAAALDGLRSGARKRRFRRCCRIVRCRSPGRRRARALCRRPSRRVPAGAPPLIRRLGAVRLLRVGTSGRPERRRASLCGPPRAAFGGCEESHQGAVWRTSPRVVEQYG